MEDFTKFLDFEIKKELADRYFGFRKLIEEDKMALARNLRHSNQTVGNRIVLDLTRLYILLRNDELIRLFLKSAGLGEKFFFDPYILTSPTIRARVFAGVRTRGFTASGRFKNMLIDTYGALESDISEYREKMAALVGRQEVIEEEIKIFYRKNDIGAIMGFLRAMDSGGGSGSGGGMEGGLVSGYAESMEKKMRVLPPPAVEDDLPILPPLTPLSQIKKELKKLAKVAFDQQKGDRFL